MSAFLTCPFLYCITLFLILICIVSISFYTKYFDSSFSWTKRSYCSHFSLYFILTYINSSFFISLSISLFLFVSVLFNPPPSPSSANGRRFLLEYERLIKDAYPVSNVQNSSYRTGKYITLFPFKRVFVVCQI